MAGENWRRLADYIVARRVALGMRDRRALAAATGVTERTLGKLENGQRVSASTLGAIENQLGWAPGSWRRILAGGEPVAVAEPVAGPAAMAGPAPSGDQEAGDSTLEYLASTPGLPPEVVRGLIALARNWREGEAAEGEDESDADRRRA
jgi:DNA-binding Xre family transcriptional regulator